MTIAISIRDLQKTYANGFEALKGISLEVAQGDFFALLGPNGAGKSTTIGVISTLINKSGGAVEVFGRNVDTHVFETKFDLGIVPQEVNFSLFEKVGDIVRTQAGYYGMPRQLAAERTEKYLRKLGLWDKRDERSRSLSGGMKRRLMIARALVHEPRLLILDEPTAAIDAKAEAEIFSHFRDLTDEKISIIISHRFSTVRMADHIIVLEEGEITEEGSHAELMEKKGQYSNLFELQARGYQ